MAQNTYPIGAKVNWPSLKIQGKITRHNGCYTWIRWDPQSILELAGIEAPMPDRDLRSYVRQGILEIMD